MDSPAPGPDAAEEPRALEPAGVDAVGEVEALGRTSLALLEAGQVVEGLEQLVRAVWRLGQLTPGADRWVEAVLAVGTAAQAAELYEVSAELYAGLRGHDGGQRRAVGDATAQLLLEWGLRLHHLGRDEEAGRSWARCLEVLDPEDDRACTQVVAALAQACLGAADEALRTVRALVPRLREQQRHREARLLHLAGGIAARSLGDLTGARRELVAADELWAYEGTPAERVVVHQELAALALAERPDGDPDGLLRRALRVHAERLWELRLQRLAFLRHARHREQRDADRGRVDEQLLQDPLTALGNRRRFDQHLAQPAGAVPHPESLVLLDVDDFKSVNDLHSHPVGDAVLRDVAQVLRAHSRAEDVAVRLGGDEFALFLQTAVGEAVEIAERIRREIAASDWERLSTGLRVTVSGGIAARTPGQTGAELFADADRKLYEAKRSGRNRMVA